MKKKTKIIIGIITIAFVFVAVWWFSPKYFLKHVNPQDIVSIDVFNGNDGNGFTITDKEDIEFLTEHIQSIPMKKEEISIGMGYTYRVTFLNEKGKEIDEFIINGPTAIKQGAIFYQCNGELKEVEDYLIELERAKFPDTDWIKGQENHDEKTIEAQITNIEEGIFWVQIDGCDVKVPITYMNTGREPQIGDTIKIIYTGEINKEKPAIIENVLQIYLVDENQ